ncbi:exo-beta-N-acetylmuramidase NamZ family protein [Joostella sp. CR20]|uniref:exo-beta-N-acetylmuramidase NamZ family protein n=1 Tax=Joostella sp. CR20 TaxID=2804312 RepID=UPI00313CF443
MRYFMSFKNTFLLLFLVVISCANGNQEKKAIITSEETPQEKPIIVGANSTEAYLPLLKNKRVGIVANQTSVIFKNDETYTHLVDSLSALNINIQKIFSPEHGFRGKADAGELLEGNKDARTGIEIVSLYGKHKKPAPAQLKAIDIMVFDIQDVGVRFYTYTSTLHLVMEACAENNIPLIVLDRPNPNASYVDGPTLEMEHASFLGKVPIPLVYGLTIGEYGKMLNGEKWLTNKVQCDLTVIPVKNYNHELSYSLPIRPSPNLPNDQSILLYPSLGLFEGTHVNAGRGTEFQFQRYGAPWLDKNVFSFEYTPKPNFGSKDPKHNGKLCYGEDLSSVTPPKEVTMQWIIKAYQNSNDKANFFKTASFTLHAGNNKLQKQIEAGMPNDEIKATWQEGIENFKKIRSKYFIYE